MLPSFVSGFSDQSTLWLSYFVYLLFRFAQYLIEVPTIRMIEYSACHRRLEYNGTSQLAPLMELDEPACKIASVQQQVSKIVGWKMSFDAIPGFLSVIYFGGLADRSGHRVVLTLCCIGYLSSILWVLVTCYLYRTFAVSLVWLSAFFLLAGGGPLTFGAVIAALVVDHLDVAARRTRYLFILAAMPHLGKVIAPPTAALLMARNIYLPHVVSSVAIIACIMFLQFVKDREFVETTTPAKPDQTTASLLASPESQSHEETSGSGAARDDSIDRINDASVSERPGKESQALHTFRELKGNVLRLHDNPILRLCYLAFFLKSNAMASEAFVFQYLSEKLGWPLRDTTILRFALSSSAVLTTLLFAPLTNTALTRRGWPAHRINLGIINLSLFVLVGSFILAWRTRSPMHFILSMVGAGLCEGLDPALQGLLSIVGLREDTGLLLAFACMCSLLGDVTGGPLMFALMSFGRTQNSPSDGYCFLASAIIFGAMCAVTFTIEILGRRRGIELYS